MWPRRALAGILAGVAPPAAAQLARPPIARGCAGTLYLTIDTGWSREAEMIAAAMARHGVRATLFVAHEPTHSGNRNLDPAWAPSGARGRPRATSSPATPGAIGISGMTPPRAA